MIFPPGHLTKECRMPRKISDERKNLMIAKCNMKINGRWVKAGERYDEEPKQISIADTDMNAPAEPETASAEASGEVPEEKAEVRPKAPSRRKKTAK